MITRRLFIVGAGAPLLGCAEQRPPPAPPPLRTMPTAPPQPVTRVEAAPPMRDRAPELVAGLWRGQARDRGFRGGRALSDWELQLSVDGTYRSTLTYPAGGTLQHWGRFMLGAGFIRLHLEGWEPREECGNAGCAPLNLPEQDTIVLAGISDMQLVTERGTLQRVR